MIKRERKKDTNHHFDDDDAEVFLEHGVDGPHRVSQGAPEFISRNILMDLNHILQKTTKTIRHEIKNNKNNATNLKIVFSDHGCDLVEISIKSFHNSTAHNELER